MLTPDSANDRRRQIAHILAMRTMQPMPAAPIDVPAIQPVTGYMGGPITQGGSFGDINYQGHSPTSSFDFSSGGVFDPSPGAGPSMQGGAPAATGRDFGSTPAQDWGGVNDPFGNSPNPTSTMSAPGMHASPNAVGTFDTGPGAMMNAPSLSTPGSGAFAPAGREAGDFGFGGFGQGFAQGFSEGLGAGLGGLGGLGGGESGSGAVGGMDTSGSGSSESGSSGVG